MVVGILLQCHSAMIYKVPTQSVEISGVLLLCVDGVESAPGLRVAADPACAVSHSLSAQWPTALHTVAHWPAPGTGLFSLVSPLCSLLSPLSAAGTNK